MTGCREVVVVELGLGWEGREDYGSRVITSPCIDDWRVVVGSLLFFFRDYELGEERENENDSLYKSHPLSHFWSFVPTLLIRPISCYAQWQSCKQLNSFGCYPDKDASSEFSLTTDIESESVRQFGLYIKGYQIEWQIFTEACDSNHLSNSFHRMCGSIFYSTRICYLDSHRPHIV